MKYYIVFAYEGKAICGCWKAGKDKEEAIENAEFAIAALHPEVKYDETYITNQAE